MKPPNEYRSLSALLWVIVFVIVADLAAAVWWIYEAR